MASSASAARSSGNSGKGSPTVSLASDVDTLADNGIAILKFTFSDKPVGFALDDIKVSNGTVTNLIQDATNPNIYTAIFIGGLNEKSMMSTIQLDGAYTDLLGRDGTPSNTVTIKNLETKITPTVGFTSNNASMPEGNSGTTPFNFTVQLSSPVTEPVTVYYSTDANSGGSAKANTDYVPVTSSVTFAPGETSKTIAVNVIGDTTYEANEYFYLSLTSAKNATIVTNGAEGYRNSWVAATISNDDAASTPTVGFTSNNASMTEGNSGTKAFNFTLQLSAAAKEPVTVNYSTEANTGGSAKATTDYIPVTSSVTFAPGETSKVVSVNVIGDTTYEANEYFYLSLTSATNGTIVTNGAEGYRSSWVAATIINDDAPSLPTVGFTSNNASITEGNSGTKPFNFTLQLSAASKDPVTVHYSTEANTGGSAKANTDYVPVTSSVTFAPGETSKTVAVAVIGDRVYEANEYFYLSLTSAQNANIVTNGAEGYRNSWVAATISNDDLPSTTLGIFGTPGKDTLGGKSGDDYLDGKGGPDLLTGYAGSDTFVLAKAYAAKTADAAAQIMDFGHGVDHIGLLGDLSYSGLKISQGSAAHAADAIVALPSGDVLAILVGVNAATIGAADFVAVA